MKKGSSLHLKKQLAKRLEHKKRRIAESKLMKTLSYDDQKSHKDALAKKLKIKRR